MKIRVLFAWYDLWIGVFIDKPKRRVYIFPVPMIGIVIQLAEKKVPAISWSPRQHIEDETDMLFLIASYVGCHRRQLEDAYQHIKISGWVTSFDLRYITSMGIPIMKTISDLRGGPLRDVCDDLLRNGSTVEEVEKAFQAMTGPNGIFRPRGT